VAVVVVVIVLLAALQVALVQLDDPEGPPPEWEDDGTLSIASDEEWKGLDQVMEAPVVIRDGGNLRIVDCNLDVLIEDLVVGESPWFDVEQGGELEIIDSSINTVVDPRLETATWMGKRSWIEDSIPPYLHRAVNLRRAERPVLSFDVRVIGEGGEMVVAYQPAPEEDLKVFERVDVVPRSHGEWIPVQVDLSPLAGSIVLMFILPMDAELESFLISGPWLTEDGGRIPGELASTGMAASDKWGYVHGRYLFEEMDESHWRDLIDCSGRLGIKGSEIACPPGLNRSYDAYHGGWLKIEKELWNSWPRIMENLQVGGDIFFDGSTVDIEDSQLRNVAVKGVRSNVTLDGLTMTADREMITLYDCVGTASDCDLRMEVGVWGRYGWRNIPNEPRSWAMAIWNNLDRGHFSITDSTFADSPMGVDLTNASVDLSGCTFINTSWLSIWDHDCEGLGSWEDLNSSNEFVDTIGYRYFRTHSALIQIRGLEDVNPNEYYHYIDFYVEKMEGEDYPAFNLIWFDGNESYLYAPTYVVDREGDGRPVSWMEARSRLDWTNDRYEMFDTSGKTFDFWIPEPTSNEYYEQPPEPGEDWRLLDEGGMYYIDDGHLDLDLAVVLYRLLTQDVAVLADQLKIELRMDGEMVEVQEVELPRNASDFDRTYVMFNLDVPPGIHDVNVTLKGRVLERGGVEELSWYNRTFVRLDGNSSPQSLFQQLERGYRTLLVDPGESIDIDLTHLPVADWDEGYSFRFLDICMGEGASVTVNHSDPEEEVIDYFFEAGGPGEIIIRDIAMGGATLSMDRTSLVLDRGVALVPVHQLHHRGLVLLQRGYDLPGDGGQYDRQELFLRRERDGNVHNRDGEGPDRGGLHVHRHERALL
jgi:hypothetical protein